MRSTHSPSDVDSEPHVDDARELRAELRVRPSNPTGCALTRSHGTHEVVARDDVCVDGDCDPGCECRATVETDEGTRMVGKRMDENCVCPVFRDHDCVSSVKAVDRGELVIEVSLPSRDVLTSIVETLRDRGATVELRSISNVGASSSRRQLTIDANSITEKQREAIAVAIEAGYYEKPREADLSDLADRLDVSRSAVSQRLTAAESTLIGALYDVESSTHPE